MLKYWAALSYAECADSGIILKLDGNLQTIAY